MFVSRQKSLAYLWQWSTKPQKSPILFLEGAPGIGKTSLLSRFREGSLGSYLVPVIIDASKLPLESPGELLWRFAQQLTEGLRTHQLDAPEFEKRMVTLRSWEAFRDHYWRILPHFLDGRILILAMDNFDYLFANQTLRGEFSTFRKYLMQLLNEHSQTRAIFVIRGRAHGFTDKLLFPFNQFQTHRLRTFSFLESVALMNRPKDFTVYQDVAELIFTLTAGNPGDIQRLCYALYERFAANQIRQLAMSDVLSILDVELAPKDFHTNVYGRYSQFFKQLT